MELKQRATTTAMWFTIIWLSCSVASQTTDVTGTVVADVPVTVPTDKSFADIYGVGFGVVIVGVFFVIGIIICILGRMSSTPMYSAVIGTLLPIIVFLILYLLPKEASRKTIVSEFGSQTELRPLTFGIFFALVMFVTLISLFLLLKIYCCTSLRAYAFDSGSTRISSGRFKELVKEETEEDSRRAMLIYLEKQEIEEKDYSKRRRPINQSETDNQARNIEELRRDPLKKKVKPRRLNPMREPQMDVQDPGDNILTKEGEFININQHPQYRPQEDREEEEEEEQARNRNLDFGISVDNTNYRRIDIDNPHERTLRMTREDNILED